MLKSSLRLFGLFFFLILTSCASSIKKNKGDAAFSGQSDFLNQGKKIESYEVKPQKKPIADEKAENNDNHRQDLTQKTEQLAQKENKRNNAPKARADSKNEENVTKEVDPSKESSNVTSKEPEQPEWGSFPFKVGEEVTLSATYLGVEAGKILIGVDKFKKFNGKRQFHFYAIGKTSPLFSMFYKVRNKIDSLWDPNFRKPSTLAFDVAETKQKYKIRVYFDWLKKEGEFFEEGWHKKKGDYRVKKKWALKPRAQDVLSAIFYTRTLPLDVGKTYHVDVMNEDKFVEVHLKVDRKEELSTRVGKFNTIVIKPTFTTDGKFKQVGDISVWLTDDSYRQVVRIESKIKIGTVVAKLHSLNRPE